MKKITMREVGLLGFENIAFREKHLRFKIKSGDNRLYVDYIGGKWYFFSENLTDFILSGCLNRTVKSHSAVIKEISFTSELKKLINQWK